MYVYFFDSVLMQINCKQCATVYTNFVCVNILNKNTVLYQYHMESLDRYSTVFINSAYVFLVKAMTFFENNSFTSVWIHYTDASNGLFEHAYIHVLYVVSKMGK
jgi:hypothetical protein